MKKIALAMWMLPSFYAVADSAPIMTHTELSYVNTSGNTKTEAFSLGFMGKKRWDAHALQLDLDGLYGTQEKIENKNKFIGEVNYDYQFAGHFTVNYIFNYKDDKFSGYDYQWFTGPGVKYLALENERHNLFFQLNIVYSSDKEMKKYYTDDTKSTEIVYPYVGGLEGAYLDPDSGTTNSNGGNLAKLSYSWLITEMVKFIQTADYRSNWDDHTKYFINSKTALESKMSDIFSMGLSYKVAYSNKPPTGVERTDKTFMVSLIADY